MANRTLPETATEIPQVLWEQFEPNIKAGIISEYQKLSAGEPSFSKDGNIGWMKAFLNYVSATPRHSDQNTSWLKISSKPLQNIGSRG